VAAKSMSRLMKSIASSRCHRCPTLEGHLALLTPAWRERSHPCKLKLSQTYLIRPTAKTPGDGRT
jgi:hypothetical protein